MDKNCDRCQHNRPSSTDYCYMFEDKPETVPCGQHDKYASIRKATGRMVKANPFMLHLLMTEAQVMTKERLLFDNARYPMNNADFKPKETD